MTDAYPLRKKSNQPTIINVIQMRKQCTKKEKMHQDKNNMFFLIGLMNIVWFIFRTGGKPSRANYPCQVSALQNSNLWIATYIVPLTQGLHLDTQNLFENKKIIGSIAVISLVGGGAFYYFSTPSIATVDRSTLENGLILEAVTATETPVSDIFAVTKTMGNDGGVEKLLQLMDSQDLTFYNSDKEGAKKGSDGLIVSDDVVLIKVNCQWDERGGTNTDLLRELITAITSHPDGFTGEIIVADNGQGDDHRGAKGFGGSFTWENNNAVDTNQTVQDVVESFSSSKVSTYLWDTITKTRVNEYSEGDIEDGYVIEDEVIEGPDLMISYPKFVTEYGTFVSFKNGIWDPKKQEYDTLKLKVINLSNLKGHAWYGVSASVKNYMGVPTDILTSEVSGKHYHSHLSIGKGGMGTMMVKTRYPVLNIIDAIWIQTNPVAGPRNRYDWATPTNVIIAGTDPVALDYWSAKYILNKCHEIAKGEKSPHLDPDYTDGFGWGTCFGVYLRHSADELIKGGYDITLDESRMNVFITENT